MQLSSQQRKELQDALIDAFPNTASLERMLSFELDKSIRAIAGEGSLQDIVFKLIQTANAQGWVEDLVRGACNDNPGNPRLRAIVDELLPKGAAQELPDNTSWIQYEIPWIDGSKMVVLPIKPEGDLVRCIGKHPVTNDQYKKFVEETGHPEPSGQNYICDNLIQKTNGKWQGPFKPWENDNFKEPSKPVVCVSCEDAEKYCEWVNKISNQEDSSMKNTITTLPSLFVWSFAAFGEFNKFTWLDEEGFVYKDYEDNVEIDWLKQTKSIHHKSIAPLEIDKSQKRWNARGISDMFGNIWEWSGRSGVLLGGSFLDDLSLVTPFVEVRDTRYFHFNGEYLGYNTCHSDLGFRIAAYVPLGNLPHNVQEQLTIISDINDEIYENKRKYLEIISKKLIKLDEELKRKRIITLIPPEMIRSLGQERKEKFKQRYNQLLFYDK